MRNPWNLIFNFQAFPTSLNKIVAIIYKKKVKISNVFKTRIKGYKIFLKIIVSR